MESGSFSSYLMHSAGHAKARQMPDVADRKYDSVLCSLNSLWHRHQALIRGGCLHCARSSELLRVRTEVLPTEAQAAAFALQEVADQNLRFHFSLARDTAVVGHWPMLSPQLSSTIKQAAALLRQS